MLHELIIERPYIQIATLRRLDFLVQFYVFPVDAIMLLLPYGEVQRSQIAFQWLAAASSFVVVVAGELWCTEGDAFDGFDDFQVFLR